MKKFLRCCLCIVMLVMCMISFNFTDLVYGDVTYGETEDFGYYYNESGEVCIEYCINEKEELIIPDEIDGHKVVRISLYIDRFSIIKAIYIPAGIDSCDLTVYSAGFEKIYVDENNESYVSIDGALYTKDKKTLLYYPNKQDKDYIIPEGVETIDVNALSACDADTLTLPGTIKYVYVDYENENYQPIEEYFSYVLWETDTLTDIYVSKENEHLTSIDGILYSKDKEKCVLCPKKKTGKVAIDENTKIIEVGSFYNSGINSVSFGDKVEQIGYMAFYGCPIEEVILPESCESIGYYAFGYSKLKKISIPAKVKELNANMFLGTSLEEVVFEEDSDYVYEDKIVYSKDKTKVIFASSTVDGAVTIPEGVTQICDSAFKDIESITYVLLPDTLEKIGDKAFESCTGLDKIYIPENVTYIGSCAFSTVNIKNFIIESTKIEFLGFDAFLVYEGTTITVRNEQVAEMIREDLWWDNIQVVVEDNAYPKLDKSSVTLYTGNVKNSTMVNVLMNNTTYVVKWKSSNKSVATVKEGKIKAKGVGKATITATVGDKTAQVSVTVKNPSVKIVNGSEVLKKIKVKKKKSVHYKVNVNPAKAKVRLVCDEKSKKIAKVSYKNGIITVKGLKKGSTEVKLKCGDGVKKVKITVI